VLHLLQPLTGTDGKGYLLPSVRNASRPMSENTFNAALRTMGFTQQQHTAHGFRGTASTLLNEQQWNKDAIELQLSHMPRDKTRASYNSADHLALRREMMQAWANYLDELRLEARRANALLNPCMDFMLQPSNRPRTNPDPPRKTLFGFELINHRTAQACLTAYLRQAKNSGRRGFAGIEGSHDRRSCSGLKRHPDSV